jgi:hypothetical protein
MSVPTAISETSEPAAAGAMSQRRIVAGRGANTIRDGTQIQVESLTVHNGMPIRDCPDSDRSSAGNEWTPDNINGL